MNRNVWHELVAGTAGGMAGIVTGHPLDTVKTLLQHQSASSKHFSAVFVGRKLLRDGKLFSGLRYPLLSNAPINALVFWSNAGVHASLPDHSWKHRHIARDVVSGATAGALSSIVVCPSELLKCRTQTHACEPWVLVHQVVQQQGYRGLYRGFGATLLRESPSYATWFAVYEGCKRYEPESTVCRVAASALAGVTAWTVSFPADVAKTIIQTTRPNDNRPLSIVTVLGQQYRAHGLRSWFRGWVPTAARAGPVSVVTFAVYEQVLKSKRCC